MEWLVEVASGIVSDRGMLQIHHHRPSRAEETVSLRLTFGLPLSRLGRADASIALLSLLHRLGYSRDGFGQLLFTHHAVRLIEPLAKSVITVVALLGVGSAGVGSVGFRIRLLQVSGLAARNAALQMLILSCAGLQIRRNGCSRNTSTNSRKNRIRRIVCMRFLRYFSKKIYCQPAVGFPPRSPPFRSSSARLLPEGRKKGRGWGWGL